MDTITGQNDSMENLSRTGSCPEVGFGTGLGGPSPSYLIALYYLPATVVRDGERLSVTLSLSLERAEELVSIARQYGHAGVTLRVQGVKPLAQLVSCNSSTKSEMSSSAEATDEQR